MCIKYRENLPVWALGSTGPKKKQLPELGYMCRIEMW